MNKGAYATYRAERDKGLTYQQIADKYGVTRQNVGIACAKYNPNKFRFQSEDKVIYPNLRNWMNTNKVGVSELLRRMRMSPGTGNHSMMRAVLRGKSNPRKALVDTLLSVTGMTYEELFEVSK